MNDAELFMRQIQILRHQLAGAVDAIDILMELAARPTSEEPEACKHPIPARRPIPTMGHVGRYICEACGSTVED